ncbi:signal peptidase II [Mycoplasmopsis mustelae]|uniref:Signal peptidase II n=1 Tax=Mycoplasmopsis mustelae TaxID=171289 RepID=A0A4R7UC38_9BACT|nr:signal peptidase II [Mycoplasmopsis mustelae]TDV23248.1 signal peptidase II [Mycoplasmopsis mustelae]
MNKFKIKKFLHYLKNNKKRILITYIFMFGALIVFLAIDQITKNLLFSHGAISTLNNHQVQFSDGSYKDAESIYPGSDKWINYVIIGVRSIWHGGITFAKTRNTNLIQTISILLFILIFCYGFFIERKNKTRAILIGCILAGDLGNALDRFIFAGYVKDIFYIPFVHSNGTFNFADALIFSGIIGLLITLLIPSKHNHNYKRHQEAIL